MADAKLKTDVLVEGTNWNVAQANINHPTEEKFVVDHIDDNGTYSNIKDRAKKEQTLRLAYKAIQDNTPKAQGTKQVELPLK